MKNVKRTMANWEKELIEIQKELETLPEGYLTRKKTSYYHAIGRTQTGITKNILLIQQLCRKKYLLVRRGQLEMNLTTTSSEQLDTRAAQELIASLPKAYQTTPIHYFYHPQVEKWPGRQQKDDLFPESAIYTYNNINFRSMAERIIAEQLDKYGLLYRYEHNLNLLDQQVSPDFLVKNPFTNQTTIWEHFGAFNEKRYADNMNNKMDAYLNQGFQIGYDLITTYHYHIRNSERVRQLIKEIIL